MFIFSSEFIFSSLALLLASFYVFVRRRHSYWERCGIKGPRPTFLLGTTFKGDLSQSLCLLNHDHYLKYGRIVGLYNGLQPALLLADPNILKSICVTDFHAFPEGFKSVYNHPVMANMTTMMYGSRWKRTRSLLTPTFSTGKLKKMVILMNLCLEDAMKELDRVYTESSCFDPKHFWSCYNMDLIAKCCFGSNLNAHTDKDSVILRNFIEFFTGNMPLLLMINLLPDWAIKLFKLTLFPKKNLEFFRDLTLRLIENRKNCEEKTNDFLQILIDNEADESLEKETDHELKQSPEYTTHHEINAGNQEQANSNISFLSTLPKESKKLSSEEIVGACVTFLVAGYETTSTLLTWTCYQLALNPEIQRRLYEEISSTDYTIYENLVSLPYLDAVLHEVLRLHPPVVLIQRVSHQDYVIPETSIELKKGTLITVPVYSMHHDPEFFPEPQKFQPERFMPENKGKIKPFTFMPFGGGPRFCMGARFALVNAKLSLCTLLSKYKLFKIDKTPDTPRYSTGAILLHSADNFYIGLERRK